MKSLYVAFTGPEKVELREEAEALRKRGGSV